MSCFQLNSVAPYVGAWIETCLVIRKDTYSSSHPMWVRGLKLLLEVAIYIRQGSHPMWVRGLKQVCIKQNDQQQNVAPYVGAWIETRRARCFCYDFLVAPYVGAWIETLWC